jgi:hypothetical protein
MALPAKDCEPGKIYRLTRDSGTTYYKICDASSKRRLEKRLGAQSPRFMKPEDRFALQALERARTEGFVLAVRLIRYRDDGGAPHESRAYVAFPPNYLLREVDKPPGYARPLRGAPGYSRGDIPSKDLDTAEKKTEDP